jgi:ribose transport system substrate-binding protein
MKKIMMLCLVLMIAAGAVFAGGTGQSGGAKATNRPWNQITVGFAQMENNISWRIAETNSMKAEADRLGVKYLYADAQSDTAKQNSDVIDMIDRGADYIVLPPREEEGLARALAYAKQKGVPVILIDRGVKGTDYTTMIASDFIVEGQEIGKWVANKSGGKGNIVILEGTAGATSTIDRQKGFMDIIGQYPNMKVIADQVAEYTTQLALSTMQNIIQTHGKNINIVYCHNDDMALGAIQALKAAGMNPGRDIIVAGVDGAGAALDLIISGEMSVTIQCNPAFGPIAFETIRKLEDGQTVPKSIVNEDMLFDASNAAANRSKGF